MERIEVLELLGRLRYLIGAEEYILAYALVNDKIFDILANQDESWEDEQVWNLMSDDVRSRSHD